MPSVNKVSKTGERVEQTPRKLKSMMAKGMDVMPSKAKADGVKRYTRATVCMYMEGGEMAERNDEGGIRLESACQ